MNAMPLVVSGKGDLLISFVPMPVSNTIDHTAEFAAQFAIGRVPVQPERTLRLRRTESNAPLACNLSLAQASSPWKGYLWTTSNAMASIQSDSA